MNTSESLRALRTANPRNERGFAQWVDGTAEAVRTRVVAAADQPRVETARRRLVPISAGGMLFAAAVATAAFLTFGSSGGPGVESATAAVKRAAAVTAAAAQQSGTAVVRITHNGDLWAGSTIRWHDADIAVSSDAPLRRGRTGSQLLVVDGIMYGVENDEWVVLGDPKSIDPGSGTTPDQYLAAVRADAGGVTLRRLTNRMTELTTHRLLDGSTVYRGTVAAGAIARESGFKEGRPIRVLPFGYVAHAQAADPAARLHTAITVGPNAVVRAIDVTWGTWRYTVMYSDLGETALLVAPANARPLRERLPGR